MNIVLNMKKVKTDNEKLIKLLIIIFDIFFIYFSIKYNNPYKIYSSINKYKKPLKVGVICLKHGFNFGNTLVKISMSSFLKSLGFEPYIVGKRKIVENLKIDLTFLNESTNLRILKSFEEIKINDYDILMVNSDQTWRAFGEGEEAYNDLFNVGFLRFAENWTIPKFAYGVSFGTHDLNIKKSDIKIVRNLLKKFTGVSVREKSAIKVIKKLLGIHAEHVLDPTMLLDKSFYLQLIKKYKNFNRKHNSKTLFVYSLTGQLQPLIDQIVVNLKFDNVNIIPPFNSSNVISFIGGINSSDAVLTDSFHGTIFSIIFNKPFISVMFTDGANERFISLNQIFHFDKRLIFYKEKLEQTEMELLLVQPNIDNTVFYNYRSESIEFLKRNLGIYYK